MANKMLIDAAHPEETRVVVTVGNRVEEFDFESQSRKPLRGNIYLAKVTRVEPSLQAAFVDYGGNRHGFLAFSEIHPDYYQIPVADREALLAEEANAHRDEDEEDNARAKGGNRRRRGRRGGPKAKAADAATGESVSESLEGEEETVTLEAESNVVEVVDNDDDGEDGETHEEDIVESVGSGDAYEDMPQRTFRSRKQYKIQEVIKRRQVLLVQVVKEERGNKGAALTTYLSLAGRYSVLMPNTARGGGISRKITNSGDRNRLKSIADELDVPEGMGVILRTAGASRTKTEVKRDFEYLMRLWEQVRETTLASNAPTLVYEEGSLIKRSIRDLYNKEIDEVLVSGEEGYKEARDFMRMLMPSHAKNVKLYRDAQPIYTRYGVEAQLDAMFSNTVQLKSGGYIVINQTEALVAIDVNSGRATREHNIEDTALKTNQEAADEIARQLRLRDLAGLIVCDFIDMDEKRNNRAVERRMKDALKTDRARIQVGRISHFGLLEMSRQRIRTGVLESSSVVCPHCAGTGTVRSVSSVALHLLRSIEDNLLKSSLFNIVVKTRSQVALYVLNQKRSHLTELETRFRVAIEIEVDETVTGSHLFNIERGEQVHTPETAYKPPALPEVAPVDAEDLAIVDEVEEEEAEALAEAEAREPRRERGRGRDRNRDRGEREDNREPREPRPAAASDEERGPRAEGEEEGEKRRRRRRRRRRGRGGDREGRRDENGVMQFTDQTSGDDQSDEEAEGDEIETVATAEITLPETVEEAVIEAVAPVKARRGRRSVPIAVEGEAVAAEPVAEVAETAEVAEEPVKKPRRGRKSAATLAAEAEAAAAPAPAPAPVVAAPAPVAAPEPVAAEPAQEEPAGRRRRELLPDTPPEAIAPAVEKPARKGWWSFGRG